MIGQRGMAVGAGIEEAATFHLDGDDVGWSVIVPATGLCIEIYAVYSRGSGRHNFSLANKNSADRQQLFVESADFAGAIHEVNLQYPVAFAA
jgi:hypothetical protein